MKKVAILFSLLQVFVLTSFAADAPKPCTLCVGARTSADIAPAAPIPLLINLQEADLAAVTSRAGWQAYTPEQKKKLTVVVSYSLDETKEPLGDIEQHTKNIIDWAKANGPFQALEVQIAKARPELLAYGIKRMAVMAQGQNVAEQIVEGAEPQDSLPALYEHGAQAYFDALVTSGDVAGLAKWVAEKDPAKKIIALVKPSSPNAFYDVARAFADGATRVYIDNLPDDANTFAAIASLNASLAGDYAYDSSSRAQMLDAKGNKSEMPLLTFVRGEDLATIVVPQGDAAGSSIVSLAGDQFAHPRRIDFAGLKDVKDTGSKGGRFLIGVPPVKQPFALIVEHSEKIDANVTKQAIDVKTERGISVEEIIRNHQAYKSYQESIAPRYMAKDTTKLRFTIGDGGEAIEATIAGDYFSDPNGISDWVWQDFFINGVRWKYGRIPELPLIQPEKVTQLPLDIHLTNEYRYQLIRENDLDGYHTYEVRFDPPPNAPASLPLYRGTVWIDSRTWTRVRLQMVQLNLTGEILANEERVDFQPFARATNQPLTPAEAAKTDPREIIWLPRAVSAQQVVSASGRANSVLRETEFTDFRIGTADFDSRHAQVAASDSRMVRETENGLRYLEKRGNGERVVKEGFENSRVFMLGGVHHDAGLDYPVVPLGGIDYFNFNQFDKGIQTNVFFAGVIVVANATHPNVANTHTNVGADFFGIAVPFTNSMYRNGEEQKSEAVKALPLNINLRAGHPIFQFGKIDVNLGIGHITYQRSEDTAPSFQVPSDTFEISPSVSAQYARWGYTISGFYDYARRTTWKPWGNLAEYDPDQKSFARFGGAIGKSFYLPKFQRIGLELNYLDGSRLDRFSKYELGFFGSQRIHGIRSGSVRAEKALLAHLSYGFVLNEQIRLEAFYDHGLLDDTTAGYHREPFQGLGIGGQTVGPYGTILRLDLGKSVGRNAQNGFVANVVFLKLF